ncbi:MAG: galactokinase family protein [Anaerolineae bacterium]
MSVTPERLIDEYHRCFGAATDHIRLVRSPYRICPLGAHVDHQLGLVTGMTIDAPIWLAYTPNAAGRIRLHSLDFSPPVEFDVHAIQAKVDSNWGNYARGAAWALSQSAPLRHGFDGVVAGSLPIGGLSSSAAVGIAYLLALEDVNGLSVSPLENVELDRAIENGYVGLNNGILDPSMILLSRPHHLTALDCQSIQFEHIPSPLTDDDFDLVIVYSGAGRMLVNSGYNQRVAECAAASTQLLQRAGLPIDGTPRLRHVPEEVFQAHQHELEAPLRKRAAHYFSENDRVRRGHSAWHSGDLRHFGNLMTQSGDSSINNYEAGSPHLITLHEILNGCAGVYGARFAGGGFGGCCLGLSDPAKRDEIIETIAREYPARHPDIAANYRVFFQKPDGAACHWSAVEDMR